MDKKSQIQKFRDKARELSADISAKEFEAALRKVAKANPDPQAADKPEMTGRKDPNSDSGKS